MDAERQRFDTLVIHTPHGTARYSSPGPSPPSTTAALRASLGKVRRRVRDRQGRGPRAPRPTATDAIAVETDRGIVSAPLVVDALGWRRVLAGRRATSRPTRRSRAASRCTRAAAARTSRSGSTAVTSPPATAGASPPTRRSGSASAPSTRNSTSGETTELLAEDLGAGRVRYQGNWIPHKLRAATEGGVFFAGDSAGHCLPLTAEGIRTALYFGIACGRELRAVVEGRQRREQAAARYAEFNDSHEFKFKWMLRTQKMVPRVPPRLLGPLIRLMREQALRRLVLPPLPEHRPAGVRRGAAGAGEAARAYARLNLRGPTAVSPVWESTRCRCAPSRIDGWCDWCTRATRVPSRRSCGVIGDRWTALPPRSSAAAPRTSPRTPSARRWRRCERPTTKIELRPWLYRIVRNTALNDLRDRPPAAAELAEDLMAGGRSAAAVAEERAEIAALTARLRALPQNQRRRW